MGKIFLLVAAFLLVNCNQDQAAQQAPATVGLLPEPTPIPGNDRPLDYIDSLQQAVIEHKSRSALQQLDSMACISEGYVTEAVDMAAAGIWDKQFTFLVNYLYHHPKSLLRPQLIWGLSANMSPADNRAQALATFRATALDSARRAGLSSAEMVFLHKILSEVNPARLD